MSTSSQKTSSRKSYSLPPLKRTPRQPNRMPEWQKRTWSLESATHTFRKSENRSDRRTRDLYRPTITSQEDLRSIYHTETKLAKPYRPISGASISSNFSRRSRPPSQTSQMKEWQEGMYKTYDTVSQRDEREQKLIKRFRSISSLFEQQAKKEQREKKQRDKEERERFIRTLTEKRKEFAIRNYKRVDNQFVTPKVLEYEKDRRNSYGLPKYLFFDINYPKPKQKQSKKSERKDIPKGKHSALPPRTNIGYDTSGKSDSKDYGERKEKGNRRSARDYEPSLSKHRHEKYRTDENKEAKFRSASKNEAISEERRRENVKKEKGKLRDDVEGKAGHSDKNKNSGQNASTRRSLEYEKLYKIYCVPGNSRIKTWTVEDKSNLAIVYNRSPKKRDKSKSNSVLPTLLRMNLYNSPYTSNRSALRAY